MALAKQGNVNGAHKRAPPVLAFQYAQHIKTLYGRPDAPTPYSQPAAQLILGGNLGVDGPCAILDLLLHVFYNFFHY